MSTTTPERTRRRGELSRAGALGSHGVLIVASLIALFPIAWLVFLSLGPDSTTISTRPASGRR